MIAAAAGPVSATCPACGITDPIRPEEVGRPLACGACGARFSVRRERRRRHDPLALRSRSLEALSIGTARPTERGLSRLLVGLGLLALAAALAPLAVRFAPAVIDALRAAARP